MRQKFVETMKDQFFAAIASIHPLGSRFQRRRPSILPDVPAWEPRSPLMNYSLSKVIAVLIWVSRVARETRRPPLPNPSPIQFYLTQNNSTPYSLTKPDQPNTPNPFPFIPLTQNHKTISKPTTIYTQTKTKQPNRETVGGGSIVRLRRWHGGSARDNDGWRGSAALGGTASGGSGDEKYAITISYGMVDAQGEAAASPT
ncbi:hypothetical protein RND71_036995 [Anisodus tanguticus]|uniref:Uncharacterized protein n=1 Tax=Anisodus tanguticus TaxID=243964 RepID=A0AAE1UYF1_9SOLA|nr:hypothetical protein RND71_036995 [Anisodus tanguticus]